MQYASERRRKKDNIQITEVTTMKNTNTTKILSIMITALLVLGLFGAALTASAAEASPITYSAVPGGLEIASSDKSLAGVVEIPAEVDGKPVVGIAQFALANLNAVTEIILPDSITSIGNWAFLNNKALVSVKLPASLVSIGKGIFKSCAALEAVELPDSLAQLSDLTFNGTAVQKIEIPDSIVEISLSALPAGVTIVCSEASYAHKFATANSIPHIINTVFYVSFIADGAEVAKVPFSFENGLPSVNYPAVPAKAGYSGVWEPLALEEADASINALYSPVISYATFMVGDDIIAELPFTVDNPEVVEPEIPAREGYTARWQTYSLSDSSVNIHAIYTPIESEAVFMADGKVVGRVVYNTNTTSILVPDVPEKAGFFGTWEAFALRNGGISVNAEYIRIEANSIYITAEKNTIEYGETVKLSAEILPFDAYNQTVRWESSNESVLKVTADPDNSLVCFVENVGEGDAVITVTVLDENGNPTEIVGSLEVTANAFSIATTVTNRIQGFFARIVSFLNSIASFTATLMAR